MKYLFIILTLMAGCRHDATKKSIETADSTSSRRLIVETLSGHKHDILPKFDRNVVNANVVDESIGLDGDSKKGIISYSVPDTMIVGTNYSIKVRITKEKGEEAKKELIIGDQHISINDTTIHSTITLDSIRVESVMSAVLLSIDSAFNIRPLSSLVQNVESIGYTEWEWEVNPQQSGIHQLKLIVKVRVRKYKTSKDMVVFEKPIKTKANYAYIIKRFWMNNWHYILSTIIIPLVGWWWNHNRKKKAATSATPEEGEG